MPTNGTAASSQQLLERLQDPDVIDGLNRLLDHLDIVTLAVESMDGFVRRGDVIAESVAETVGDLKQLGSAETGDLVKKAPRLIETGTRLTEAAAAIDVDELEKSAVLERLSEPETLKTINQLLDRLPLMAFLMESLEQFLERGDTIAENLADAVGELKHAKTEIDPSQLKAFVEALPQIRLAGEKLLKSKLMGEGFEKVVDAGVTMIDSGMMDQQIVEVLGDLGKKFAETYHEVESKPVAPVGGLFGTLRATKDPDVQKTVGFFFAFAKAFAQHLK